MSFYDTDLSDDEYADNVALILEGFPAEMRLACAGHVSADLGANTEDATADYVYHKVILAKQALSDALLALQCGEPSNSFEPCDFMTAIQRVEDSPSHPVHSASYTRLGALLYGLDEWDKEAQRRVLMKL